MSNKKRTKKNPFLQPAYALVKFGGRGTKMAKLIGCIEGKEPEGPITGYYGHNFKRNVYAWPKRYKAHDASLPEHYASIRQYEVADVLKVWFETPIMADIIKAKNDYNKTQNY